MNEERASIKVTVLDEPFRIRSAAEPEYTRQVAEHVDRTLRGLRNSAPTLEPFQTAVVGAMEITDAMMRAQASSAVALTLALDRVRGLESSIDEALAGTADIDSRAGRNQRRKESRAG